MNHDDSLDRAIDEVARDLTEGAPSPGFSTRVRARLETGPRRRAWVWHLAAACAVLAIVAYLVWPVANRQSPGVRVATPAGAPRSPSKELTPELAPAPSRPALVRARATTRPAPVRRSSPEPRMRIAIHPDAPQLDAIPEPVELTLPPIAIAELTIAPLEPEKESR